MENGQAQGKNRDGNPSAWAQGNGRQNQRVATAGNQSGLGNKGNQSNQGIKAGKEFAMTDKGGEKGLMGTLVTFLALFTGIFLLFVGDGLFITSAGVRLHEMGMSNIVIGLVNTSFFLGAALSTIMAHKVISRVGHARSFSIFGAVFAVGSLTHVLTENLYLWGVLRVFQGFSYYGLLMVVESWLNERSDTSIRSRVLATYEITFYIAFSVGLYLIGLNIGANNIFLLAAVFVILAIIPVLLTRLEEPALPPKERISMPRFRGISPLAIVGAFFAGIMTNGFFTVSSVYMLEQGFSVKEASLFATAGMFGGFAIQIPVGKFSDTYGRRPALILALSIAVLSSAATWLLQGNAHHQYVIAFFLGTGIFTIYSLSLARANDERHLADLNVVQISRGILFCYGLGALFSPLVYGVAMHFFPAKGFGGVFAALSVTLFVFTLTQKTVPKSKRSTYVPMPSAISEISSGLDPRQDEPEYKGGLKGEEAIEAMRRDGKNPEEVMAANAEDGAMATITKDETPNMAESSGGDSNQNSAKANEAKDKPVAENTDSQNDGAKDGNDRKEAEDQEDK